MLLFIKLKIWLQVIRPGIANLHIVYMHKHTHTHMCICIFVIYYIYLIFVSSASASASIQIRVRPEFEPKFPVVVVLWLGSPRRVLCSAPCVCVSVRVREKDHANIYINAPQYRIGISRVYTYIMKRPSVAQPPKPIKAPRDRQTKSVLP